MSLRLFFPTDFRAIQERWTLDEDSDEWPQA